MPEKDVAGHFPGLLVLVMQSIGLETGDSQSTEDEEVTFGIYQ